MKIPIEWLKEYINIKKTTKEIADSFTSLGLLLDKPIETYENNVYKTEILDLEHRMDRSDWLSILGCARDLATFEGLELELPPSQQEKGKQPKPEQIVKIEVECPDLVNRFNTKVFRGIKVDSSPDWLKNRLEAYGIPSINNVVDITNYVMVEYGQPMHAQDLAKMSAQEIVIRKAKEGETVTTLLGETIKLIQNQFVLTQSNKPTVIGGIVGGNTTGVDESTTDIILDAGNYNQINIRRSSRQLKIQNETVLRYDKFLHPDLANFAINRAVFLILQHAGGTYFENIDWYPNKADLRQLDLRLSRIKDLGGLDIEMNAVKKTIQSLEYKILDETPDKLSLQVPYFRTDITVEDDIVSDILRIYNYENIPISHINKTPPKEITSTMYVFEEEIKDTLVNLGLHEHILDPLVRKREDESQIALSNAFTSEKSALRTDILETLKPVSNRYAKYGKKEIGIFEVGKEYFKEDNSNSYESFQEKRVAGVLYTNLELSPKQNSDKTKKLLASLLQNIGIKKYEIDNAGNITVSGQHIGQLLVNGFKIYTEKIFSLVKHTKTPTNASRILLEINHLPTENLSLLMDIDQPFGPIYKEILNTSESIQDVEIIEEYTGEELGKGKKTVLIKIIYNTNDPTSTRSKLLEHITNTFNVVHRE